MAELFKITDNNHQGESKQKFVIKPSSVIKVAGSTNVWTYRTYGNRWDNWATRNPHVLVSGILAAFTDPLDGGDSGNLVQYYKCPGTDPPGDFKNQHMVSGEVGDDKQALIFSDGGFFTNGVVPHVICYSVKHFKELLEKGQVSFEKPGERLADKVFANFKKMMSGDPIPFTGRKFDYIQWQSAKSLDQAKRESLSRAYYRNVYREWDDRSEGI